MWKQGQNTERSRQVRLLHPKKDEGWISRYMTRHMWMRRFLFLGAGMVSIIASIGIMLFQSPELTELSRRSYGNGNRIYDLHISGLSNEKDAKGFDISLEVGEQQQSEHEIRALLEETAKNLPQILCESNGSLQALSQNLILPDSIGMVHVEWTSLNRKLMSDEGEILPPLASISESGAEGAMAVHLTMDGYEYDDTIFYRIDGAIASEQERLEYQFLSDLKTMLSENQTSKQVQLPKQWNGYDIVYRQTDHKGEWILKIVAVALLSVVSILYLRQKWIEGKLKKREMQLQQDYPTMVNQMSALLVAGYPVRLAWSKLCEQYRSRKVTKQIRYVFEEMQIAEQKLQLGLPELEVYHEFAETIGQYDYQRFVEILENKIRYGGNQQELLKAEVLRAMELRKNLCLQEAQKQEMRMMIPMFGMFLLVLAILFVPAFVGMNLG